MLSIRLLLVTFAVAFNGLILPTCAVASSPAEGSEGERATRGGDDDGATRSAPRASAEVIARVKKETGLLDESHPKGKRNLVVLEDYQTIFDDDLIALGELPEITAVHLMGTYTERGLRHLNGLANIEVVRLEYAVRVSDAVLAHIGTLSNLKELSISQPAPGEGVPRVTDRGLEALTDLRTLERLELRGVDVTDDGLRHLANFPKLRTLVISGPNLTENALVTMPRLPALGETTFNPKQRRLSVEPAADAVVGPDNEAADEAAVLRLLKLIDGRLDRIEERLDKLEQKEPTAGPRKVVVQEEAKTDDDSQLRQLVEIRASLERLESRLELEGRLNPTVRSVEEVEKVLQRWGVHVGSDQDYVQERPTKRPRPPSAVT